MVKISINAFSALLLILGTTVQSSSSDDDFEATNKAAFGGQFWTAKVKTSNARRPGDPKAACRDFYQKFDIITACVGHFLRVGCAERNVDNVLTKATKVVAMQCYPHETCHYFADGTATRGSCY